MKLALALVAAVLSGPAAALLFVALVRALCWVAGVQADPALLGMAIVFASIGAVIFSATNVSIAIDWASE